MVRVCQWLIFVSTLLGATVAYADRERARLEVERELATLSPQHPSFLELVVKATDPHQCKPADAQLVLDDKPLPASPLGGSETTVFAGEVPPGEHVLSVTLRCDEPFRAVLSTINRRLQVASSLKFRTDRGLKVHLVLSMIFKADEQEVARKLQLQTHVSAEMVAKVEDATLPAPVKRSKAGAGLQAGAREAPMAPARQASKRAAEGGRAEAAGGDDDDAPDAVLERSAAPVSARRKVMTYVGYRDGAERAVVFVRTNEPAAYEVLRRGARTLVLKLENTVVDLANNRRVLDTSYFGGAIGMITPDTRQNQVLIEIQLKGDGAPYQVTQEGNVISVAVEGAAR